MKPTMLKDDNAESIQSFGFGLAQNIDGTAASVQSTVIDATEESLVRLKARADLWVLVGTNPTAVVDGASTFLTNGEVVIVKVPVNNKIAARGGKLNITVLK